MCTQAMISMRSGRSRCAGILLSSALAGSLLWSSTPVGAVRAGTPPGGAIRIFAAPSTWPAATVLISGAIGDSGTLVSTDQEGNLDAEGNHATVTLRKGSFQIDSTALSTAWNVAKPAINRANCSSTLTINGSLKLFHGSGLYAGISGSAQISVTIASLLPSISTGAHKGQCDERENAKPLAEIDVATGSGTVQFRQPENQ